jgi:hypothetical protein
MRKLSTTRDISSWKIGTTTVAIVLFSSSITFRQYLTQITRHTCIHLFVIDVTTTTVREQLESLQKLLDPSIPLFLVADGDIPDSTSFLFHSRVSTHTIHLFPSRIPASAKSQLVVLTDEHHIKALFPETIIAVVPAEAKTNDAWKCRLILKYIQAILHVQQRSRL